MEVGEFGALLVADTRSMETAGSRLMKPYTDPGMPVGPIQWSQPELSLTLRSRRLVNEPTSQPANEQASEPCQPKLPGEMAVRDHPRRRLDRGHFYLGLVISLAQKKVLCGVPSSIRFTVSSLDDAQSAKSAQ